MGSEHSVIVSLRGLAKNFGTVHAVDGVDLDIYQGEFLTLLGPSGSGKTTVLRMIAGFETPDAGTIVIVLTECRYSSTISRSHLSLTIIRT